MLNVRTFKTIFKVGAHITIEYKMYRKRITIEYKMYRKRITIEYKMYRKRITIEYKMYRKRITIEYKMYRKRITIEYKMYRLFLSEDLCSCLQPLLISYVLLSYGQKSVTLTELSFEMFVFLLVGCDPVLWYNPNTQALDATRALRDPCHVTHGDPFIKNPLSRLTNFILNSMNTKKSKQPCELGNNAMPANELMVFIDSAYCLTMKKNSCPSENDDLTAINVPFFSFQKRNDIKDYYYYYYIVSLYNPTELQVATMASPLHSFEMNGIQANQGCQPVESRTNVIKRTKAVNQSSQELMSSSEPRLSTSRAKK
ncbi:hypothetical protein Btru_028039 [Bulinus truncatus]|nr:hypothetical protein Btru_028039 [Bulinus truncatus]